MVGSTIKASGLVALNIRPEPAYGYLGAGGTEFKEVSRFCLPNTVSDVSRVYIAGCLYLLVVAGTRDPGALSLGQP